MKIIKTMLTSISLFMSVLVSFGQVYDTTTFYGKMNFTFGNLDKTQIGTGLLREYGIDFVNLENYDGKVLHDSNWVNLDDWRMVYASLYSEQVNANANLLYLDTLNKRISQFAVPGQPVSFMGLYYNYQGLDTNAISRNLISISNGQLYDVANRTQSPYLTHSVFAVATTQQGLFTGSNQLIFRPELFISNTGKTISSLQVDPLGGNSYQTASFNTPITVNYPDTGLYPVTVKIIYTDGTINYGHTKFAVYANPNGTGARYGTGARPITNEAVIATKTYLGSVAQGDISIELAQNNTTGQIRKPLLIVEGFDPDGSYRYNPGYIDNLNTDANNGNTINLNQGLDNNNDYDLIFLHYKNGTDYIQRNAYLLEAVIQNINNRKTLYNGVRQQNVIMGMSMGGLVVRYALRDMELNAIPHDTRLFISHDAPHWGANVPVAYQALVQHLAPWKLINAGFNGSVFNFYLQWRDMFPQAIDAVNLFNTPAAKQILIQRYTLTPQNGTLTADNADHTSFMSEINTMGWPLNCRNVTLSNGNCSGDIFFPNNSRMLAITGNKSLGTYVGGLWRSLLYSLGGAGFANIATLTSVPANNVSLLIQFPLSIFTTKGTTVFDFGAWAVPNSGSSLIYQGDVYVKRQLFFGLFNTTSYFIKCHSYSSSEMLPLDNASGGQYDITQFGVNIKDINSQLHDQIGKWINATTPQPRFCFVPSVSSMALTNAQQYLFSNVCNNANCLNPSQVTNYFAPAQNQIHISYTQENANWILEQQDPNLNCIKICPSNLSISGNLNFCTSDTYTLTGVPANTAIQWSASPSGIVNLTPNAGNNSVSLTKIQNGSITLTATIIPCGNTSPVSVTTPITIGTIKPSYINTVPDVCAQYGVNTNYIPNVSYTWSFFLQPYSGNLQSFPNSGSNKKLNLNQGSGTYNIGVTITNTCGTSDITFISVNVTCSGGGGHLRISPNPASSTASVAYPQPAEQSSAKSSNTATPQAIYEIQILNKSGILKKSFKYKDGKTQAQIDVTGLAPDVYIIKAFDRKTWTADELLIQ
jgi:hypothetical protein